MHNHYRHDHRWRRLFCAALVTFVGCRGSGDDSSSGTGSGSALQLAENISVVDSSRSGASSSLSKALGIKASPPSLTAGAAWNTDVTKVFVAERSAEGFDLPNEILCKMSQAQYNTFLNKGDKKALIDDGQCSQERDNALSAGENSADQSSGSTRTSYESWTIKVTRADDNSPEIISAWIHQAASDFEPAALICGKAAVQESPSDDNPYGIFTLNFAAYPDGSSCSGPVPFKGLLLAERDAATDKVLLKFVISGGGEGLGKEASFSERATINRAAVGDSGSGSVAVSDSFAGMSEAFEFNIAFNENYFLRSNAEGDTCLSRTDFHETAWRYGVYDATGARVTRNSGFPIRYSSGGSDYHGWVGYWGLWTPNDVSISHGATVYKQTYGADGGTETQYTAVRVGGKLIKHTRNTTTLSSIKNLPLDWWDNASQISYRVRWDGSNFIKFASRMDGVNNGMWQNIAESELSTASLEFGELNFWSLALGGSVRVPLAGCQWDVDISRDICDEPTNALEVVYYTEDIMYPGDEVPTSLRCYDNCPRYDPTGGGVSTRASDYSPNASGHNYPFDTETGLLKEDGNALLLTTASGTNSFGYHSGPLFEATAANLTALACEWDPSQTCGWKAWSELSTYYTWETGPHQWNQLSALADSNGTILKFDAPLQLEYTHSQTDTAARDYKYNGVKFFLEYNGFGELHGIPGICVNMDTGAPANCEMSMGGKIRWSPEFLISEGSTVTANNTTYYVKPLEKEQIMKRTSTSTCTAAGLTVTTYDLPDISLWEDPAIGDEPTVSGAPAVIGGVVQ